VFLIWAVSCKWLAWGGLTLLQHLAADVVVC
jgi:hypothetical protein